MQLSTSPSKILQIWIKKSKRIKNRKPIGDSQRPLQPIMELRIRNKQKI